MSGWRGKSGTLQPEFLRIVRKFSGVPSGRDGLRAHFRRVVAG
jgi:hypothetical protein